MRSLGIIPLAVISFGLLGQPALANKRVALVIGNSAYQKVTRLTNPANDSSLMAETLKNAGFDVVDLKRDLKVNEMRRTLREFSDKVRDADVAVVYYAGHGMEIDGTNYVIPVDAVLERDLDAFDEAIPLDRILAVIEPARQLRLVILDACRDNPFNETMKRTIGSRAVGRGLAKVEPSSPNTLIAFAAKAGSTASDGDSKNSPFTAALVKYLPKPGLDLRKAFGFTRDDVLKATNNRQEPFVYGSLGGDDVALVPAIATPAPAPTVSAPVEEAAMQRNYEFADRVGTMRVWDAFIKKYPSGFYTELATAQRDKLAAEAAQVEATKKAKAAQEQQTRLAMEGAKAAEQAKAAEEARATEQARVAAELTKKAEEARVAEAERAKTAALAKAAEDAKAAAQARAAADLAKKTEEAKMAEAERAKAAAIAIEVQARAATDANAKDDKAVGPIAAMQPPEQTLPAVAKPDQALLADIPRLLQNELRRVGCNTGSVDGNWNAAAQRSLDLFNKYAGMKLDVKVASLNALDAVKSKSTRICPLICEHGFRADGDQCLTVTCRSGFRINDNNECERILVKKPKANLEEERTKRDRPETPSKPTGDRPAPASASDARSRDTSEHEATMRAEALVLRCKQQFGVKPGTNEGNTSNAGMAACIRNGGRAN
jgi:uncharacterized caspase-like protein